MNTVTILGILGGIEAKRRRFGEPSEKVSHCSELSEIALPGGAGVTSHVSHRVVRDVLG